MTWYRVGTVSVETGQVTVSGNGTQWVTHKVQPGSILKIGALDTEVREVISNTELTIAEPFSGATVSDEPYSIIRTAALADSLVKAVLGQIELVQSYIDGPLEGRFEDGAEELPSITFRNHPGTGMRYVEEDGVALSGGGLDQLVLQGGRAMGRAVQASPIDAELGKLLKVGAFGLGASGGSAHLAHLQDAADVSQFLADGVTSDPPDKPVLGRGHVGMHFAHTADRWCQLLAQVAGTSSGKEQFFFRRNYQGNISDWRELYHQGSILGDVSHNSGVPTGALIERGHNASGSYARFADGSQLCWRQNVTSSPLNFDTDFFGGFRAPGASATPFAAAFVEPPFVTYAPRLADGGRLIHYRVSGVTNTHSEYEPSTDAAANGVVVRYDHLAIGRWF